MKPHIFIDGREGTTGLQIHERLAGREDISLLSIHPDKRKDTQARAEYLNAADLVFLCLPDPAAREAVALIQNPRTRVIDASTAHRTAPGWVYGFAELSPARRADIATAARLANPGCHATGFLAAVAPLADAGLLPADCVVPCFSLTGYSGGGKDAIARYGATDRPAHLAAPAVYGLTMAHKHLPEMQAIAGLTHPPAFSPVICDFYSGMAVCVQLAARQLRNSPHARDVHALLSSHYAAAPLVTVTPFGDAPPTLPATAFAGRDTMELTVSGNETNILITALFDNLGKGASGAAVQNMNLMLGLDETEGLLL